MKNKKTSGNLGTILSVADTANIVVKRSKPIVPKTKSTGFIRIKWIPNKAHGKPYYYLVKTVLVDGKPRQKVVKYLGVRPPRRK